MQTKTGARGPIFLLLCAFFWGMAFSAQSTAMRYIGPNAFVFLRSTVTFAVLAAASPLLRRLGNDTSPVDKKRLLLTGTACGTILVIATILQQIGIQTTTAAKSGFITALYILIVPILGLFLGRRPSWVLWVSVAVSVAGLYCLSMQGGRFTLGIGDAFTFGSAVVYALHIIIVDRYGGSLSSVLLSTVQFGVAALISGLITLLTEQPTLTGILGCWTSIAYAAVFSGALGYTFQIVGQKYTSPTVASLIVCLESVFAAFGGWIILHEYLTLLQLFGCALMLCASVIALAPVGRKEGPL